MKFHITYAFEISFLIILILILINLNPGDLIQIVPVEVIGTVDIRSAALTVAQIR